jgi:hypothetical protein
MEETVKVEFGRSNKYYTIEENNEKLLKKVSKYNVTTTGGVKRQRDTSTQRRNQAFLDYF